MEQLELQYLTGNTFDPLRSCCFTTEEENHTLDCPVMIELNESYKQDKQRWIDSYIVQPAMLRSNAILNTINLNGHT